MDDGSSSRQSDSSLPEELIAATTRTLVTHGIADLTTQKIADEWGRSQALVHYYCGTKEELLVAYLEHVRESVAVSYEAHADDPPEDRVRWLLTRSFAGTPVEADRVFRTALIELHAQAPHHEEYRAVLEGMEEDARAFLTAAIEDGIEAGTFRNVDVAATVTFLLSAQDGGVVRTDLLGRDTDRDSLTRAFENYVASTLLAESASPSDEDTGGRH